MKAGRVFAATAMIGFLAACSLVPVEGITERPYESDHFTAELSEVGALQPEGSAFTQSLYSGYAARAKMEANELDYPSANRFLGKARGAAAGEEVAPEDPGRWLVVPQYRGALLAGRERLVRALNLGGRTEMPEEAAKAQVMYDCWVEEQAENDQPDDIALCHGGFVEAVSKIEAAFAPEPAEEEEPAPAPAPAPTPTPTPAPAAPAAAPQPEPPSRDYLVFFDFDKSNIRTDAASILDRVIAAVAELGATSVSLVGHADRSGAVGYNQRLSERRAASVRDYLSGRAIPDGNIEAVGRGEDDPRVPTPDGVREQENRRVEIRLE
jgi:outer membrane protein OmpA-like peptidoglycan-associated protein